MIYCAILRFLFDFSGLLMSTLNGKQMNFSLPLKSVTATGIILTMKEVHLVSFINYCQHCKFILLFSEYSDVFAPLMYIFTENIMKIAGKTTGLPKMFIQRFPYPNYVDDYFLKMLNEVPLFCYFFMIAFLYTHTNIVKSITYEKEKQLKVPKIL